MATTVKGTLKLFISPSSESKASLRVESSLSLQPDVMSKEVKFCTKDDTIFEVARKMKADNVGFLLVAPDISSKNNVLGVVTDRDLVVKGMAEGRDLRSTKISEIMTGGLEVVKADEDIEALKSRLVSKDIRRLAVVDQSSQNIVGIVSSADIHAFGTK